MIYEDRIIEFKHKGAIKFKTYTKEAQALKTIRINLGITREAVAFTLGKAKQTLERFENGRQNFSEDSIKQLLRRYKISQAEFSKILNGTIKLDAKQSARSVYKTVKNDPKSYRKYRKEISKEARVLKSMRKMKGLSKGQLAKITGLHRSCIDHRENGRTALKKAEIQRFVSSLGFTMEDFSEMLMAPILRTEAIEECIQILEKIETSKLNAVRALLTNF